MIVALLATELRKFSRIKQVQGGGAFFNKYKDEKTKIPHVAPDLDGYIASGENVKVARLISMAYLLYTIANAYNEEAFEKLKAFGLMHKKVKTRSTNLAVAFDLFDREIFALIKDPEAQTRLCNDYDYFKGVCDNFMNLD